MVSISVILVRLASTTHEGRLVCALRVVLVILPLLALQNPSSVP